MWMEADRRGSVYDPARWVLDGYVMILLNTYPKFIQDRYSAGSWAVAEEDSFAFTDVVSVANWEWA